MDVRTEPFLETIKLFKNLTTVFQMVADLELRMIRAWIDGRLTLESAITLLAAGLLLDMILNTARRTLDAGVIFALCAIVYIAIFMTKEKKMPEANDLKGDFQALVRNMQLIDEKTKRYIDAIKVLRDQNTTLTAEIAVIKRLQRDAINQVNEELIQNRDR